MAAHARRSLAGALDCMTTSEPMYRHFPLLMAAILGAACAGVVKQDFGHGFKLFAKQERISYGFESIRHFRVLRYRHQNLGEVGFVSVSPSGQWALYEQDGRIVLFSASSRASRDATDGTFEIPRVVRWDEHGGLAIVEYFENRVASRVPLTVSSIKASEQSN